MLIKMKRLHPDAKIPRYATEGSACFDLHSVSEDGVVEFLQPCVFSTGIAFEIPENHVMLLFSRSGHGFNNGVRLVNCVGVIDSDYRGEVKVKLTSDRSAEPFLVSKGSRVAQAMVIPIERVCFLIVDTFTNTARGDGGCGSTGI